MRAGGFRGRVRTGNSNAQRASTPPKTTLGGEGQRPMKCANCGGAHGTRDCTKAEVPLDQRRCFNCDETGHQSSKCPKPRKGGKGGGKGKGGKGRGAHVVEGDTVVHALMVEPDSDGFCLFESTDLPV